MLMRDEEGRKEAKEASKVYMYMLASFFLLISH